MGNDCSIGMRIPWSEAIPKPAAGDVWRVNLFRCVGPEAPERYLAWRPTGTPEPNFHVPEVFGSVTVRMSDSRKDAKIKSRDHPGCSLSLS